MAKAKTTKSKIVSKPTSKVATDDVKVEEVNNIEVQKENDLLKKQLIEMKNMMESLKSQIEENKNNEITTDKTDSLIEDEYIDIPLNKVIKVVSLYHGGLNLKTSEQGKVFRFNNFGDIQPILYNDLVQIMSHQHRFCKDGYFMILDSDVVKASNLEDAYKKLLSVKQIKNILDYDNDKITEILTSTTKNIKESIIANIVQHINDGKGVDKNKIHHISELYGIDLFAYARGDYEVLVNSQRKE